MSRLAGDNGSGRTVGRSGRDGGRGLLVGEGWWPLPEFINLNLNFKFGCLLRQKVWEVMGEGDLIPQAEVGLIIRRWE